jgi:hypothetical protein
MTLHAITNGTTLKLVLNPELEDLTGWTAVQVPAGFHDGWMRFEAGAFVEDWSRMEADLYARIDAEAGTARCRFITDVPGQQLTYQRKEREAYTWASAAEPDVADFPFLAAEVRATGGNPAARSDVDGAAATIIAAAESWAVIGSTIEEARIRAKRAVSAAATVEAKRAAAAVDWEEVLHD